MTSTSLLSSPTISPRACFHGEIINRRIVERVRIRQDAHAGRGDLLEPGQRRGIVGMVVGDDDFEIRVGGFREDALHAAADKFQAVARGNDQRHERRGRGQWIFHAPVVAGYRSQFDWLPNPGEVIGQGAACGLDRVVFSESSSAVEPGMARQW